ncbi:putative transcription initiation factor TFIID subunit 13 [Aspergillus granulosus]|uniref:Transcription initiation factor TFIID subunit 13 n=1 Tax=Aspergillus granulosus TaxID=176169 RepID=A0ABR4GSS7_9EURO
MPGIIEWAYALVVPPHFMNPFSPPTGISRAVRTPNHHSNTNFHRKDRSAAPCRCFIATEIPDDRAFSPDDTSLIRAGYKPQFNPSKTNTNLSADVSTSTPDANSKGKKKMAEPRARAARHKGQMNFASELRLLLLAYGDPAPHPSFPSEPLPETVRVLDEIVTDFVLEMCHGAAQYANYSRRQKIKVDDFRFALRRDPNKLGRVQELLRMERELKEARKAFDQNDDQVGNLKDAGKKGLEELSGDGPVDGKKSKGKGKRAARRDSDATEDTAVKKRKTAS